ncbi:hypothetical protein HPB50_014096 [Hyalomma asiaticum]|uniref:Uncharacterized protein n=1 Tax=Hyalomma asiaticum TaxID=266040 RepID=A0ACB7TKN0_HYAAI|nr:hypothetical protein HPB50_014096 [Hyalomma asiaticum]
MATTQAALKGLMDGVQDKTAIVARFAIDKQALTVKNLSDIGKSIRKLECAGATLILIAEPNVDFQEKFATAFNGPSGPAADGASGIFFPSDGFRPFPDRGSTNAQGGAAAPMIDTNRSTEGTEAGRNEQMGRPRIVRSPGEQLTYEQQDREQEREISGRCSTKPRLRIGAAMQSASSHVGPTRRLVRKS